MARTFQILKDDRKSESREEKVCLHCWSMFTNRKECGARKLQALITGSRMLTLITHNQTWLICNGISLKCRIGFISKSVTYQILPVFCLFHAWQPHSFSPSSSDPNECFFIINNSFGYVFFLRCYSFSLSNYNKSSRWLRVRSEKLKKDCHDILIIIVFLSKRGLVKAWCTIELEISRIRGELEVLSTYFIVSNWFVEWIKSFVYILLKFS